MNASKMSPSLLDFEKVTSQSADTALLQDLADLVKTVQDPVEKEKFKTEMHAFHSLFQLWKSSEKAADQELVWDDIKTPTADRLIPYDSIASKQESTTELEDEERELLNKLVVLKLNGGLGTTMGCKGPKSAIEVRTEGGNEYTFLDLTVQQIAALNKQYGVDVPLVLMNSFNTHDETDKIIRKYQDKITLYTFNQKRFPRLWKESLRPVPKDAVGKLSEWFPPGHGDIYDSFVSSDLYRTLRNMGKEIVFISNIDNLGATVDLNILKWMNSHPQNEFCMEVTNKTRADVKGGTIVEYRGRTKLLEIAQVPPKNVEEFKSIKKFKIFNTNNMWMRMEAVEERLKDLKLDVIVNYKEEGGKPVIQLETAAGAAIEHFRNAVGINVPRSRFLPVKGCADLLLVQSNLYKLQRGTLVLNPKRLEMFGEASVPTIKLGDNFKKVGDYMSRFKGFPDGLPDLVELEHLTVSGDVTFGSGVSLKGSVIIVANKGSRIDIPSGSKLENKVISGNLQILDH